MSKPCFIETCWLLVIKHTWALFSTAVFVHTCFIVLIWKCSSYKKNYRVNKFQSEVIMSDWDNQQRVKDVVSVEDVYSLVAMLWLRQSKRWCYCTLRPLRSRPRWKREGCWKLLWRSCYHGAQERRRTSPRTHPWHSRLYPPLSRLQIMINIYLLIYLLHAHVSFTAVSHEWANLHTSHGYPG
jgi:hypothetical protein